MYKTPEPSISSAASEYADGFGDCQIKEEQITCDHCHCQLPWDDQAALQDHIAQCEPKAAECAQFGIKPKAEEEIKEEEIICDYCHLPVDDHQCLQAHIMTCHPEMAERTLNLKEVKLVCPEKGQRSLETAELDIMNCLQKRLGLNTPTVEYQTNSKRDCINLQCSQCLFTCHDQHLLDKHIRTHLGNRGSHGRNREQLAHHHRSCTRRTLPKCEVCGKVFKHSWALAVHERRIHSAPERLLGGEVGGKTSAKDPGSTAHARGSYGEKLTFSCDVCAEVFERIRDLSVHQFLHAGKCSFSCDYCGEARLQIAHLPAHKRLHTGKCSFSCDACGKAFVTTAAMRAHKRFFHAGKCTFKCDTCGKVFKQRLTELPAHKRAHEEKCVASCAVCGKGFERLAGLMAHKCINTV